jgi:hypothetical protein
MHVKILISFLLVALSFSLTAQENSNAKRQRSRLNFGLSLNIPSSPTNVNYGVGFGINQQYEFLLGSHWSAVQSLGFNNINGKTVNEFYENENINVEYEYFRTVALQLGMGFYFGEGQSTFFILFKGGVAQFWTVNPPYPEIVVNGNVVKQAIPREEVNGTFWFFDPKIGWQFNRLQISLDYHGTINQDIEINVWNLGVAYNIIKP